MTSAIVLAGGSSIRMNSEIPKQFLFIEKKMMVLEYSINAFRKNPNIDEIVLVCHEDWMKKITSEIKTTCNITIGGETRSESSIKGLLSCNKSTSKVLIHDAARPYVSQRLINDCLYHLEKYDASIPIINCDDSLINVNTHNQHIKYLDRNSTKLIQTPQGFNYKKITEALKNKREDYSDDLSALLNYHKDLDYILFDGDKKNFKITNESDLELAKKISNEI